MNDKASPRQPRLQTIISLSKRAHFSPAVIILALFCGSINFDSLAQNPGGVSTNLGYWLKADAGITGPTEGGEVTSWTEQANSVTNTGTAGNVPTYRSSDINYNPSLSFNGTDQFLTINNLANLPSGTGNRSLYVVGKLGISNNAFKYAFSHGTNASNQAHGFGQSNSALRGSYNGVNEVNSAGFFTVDQPFLGAGFFDGTTAYIGKDAEELNSLARAWNTGSTVGYVGRWVSNSLYWNGEISEVITYDQNLSSLDRLRVESYLGIKYGIALSNDNNGNTVLGETISGSVTEGDYVASNGTTIIWDYSANTSYHFDIAGIGRDNSSGLDQKQSKSSNSDAIVTMSTEKIRASNAANGTSLTDGDFLLWGNNDATISANSDLPAGYTGRLNKEWVVEMTGTVSDVHVEFDILGTGLIGSQPSHYTLLIDADGDFTSGATAVVATSVGGGKVTFVDIDFTDGQYFTLATSANGPGGVGNDLQYWIKAGEGPNTASDGASITSWLDLSSNGVTHTSSGGVNPTFQHNGINHNYVARFDGTEYMSIDDFSYLPTGSQARSIFFLGRPSLITGGQRYALSHGTNANSQSFSIGQNNANIRMDAWNDGFESASITANEAYLLSGRYAGGAGGNASLDKNGEELTSAAETWNTTSTAGYLGRRVNAASYYTGDIGEIIYYDSELSNMDKRRVETYLAIKYGITLSDDNDGNATPGEAMSGSVTEGDYIASDSTTIIWDYSANTTYHFDIAGIGRDDNGSLNQKQSTSQEIDGKITIGLGTIATLNATNANSFSTDKSFMLWGNDDGVLHSDPTELPAGFTNKLTREWTIEETGTVGNVQLTLNINGLGLGEVSTIALVIDEDGNGDFTNGTIRQVAQASSTDSTVTFNNVDFADGEKFTFASNPCHPGGVSNNLHVWMKADAGTNTTTDAADVTSWNSHGPKGFLAEDGLDAPTYLNNGINFNPSLEFGGANHQLIVDDGIFEGGAKANMFSYVIGTVNGTNQEFINQNVANVGGSSTYQLQINNGSNAYYDLGRETTATGRTNGAWGASIGQPYLWSAGAASTTATPLGFNKYITRDNNTVSTHNGTSTANGGTNDFYIGTFNNNGNDLNGSISEIIILDGIPTAGEEDRIQSYLAIKYGITLNSMNYVNSSGTTIWTNSGGYDNDIAAIGRDDDGCLNQKQSKSVNADAAVTIGLGTIASDNVSNANTFASDGDFMIWGNDDAAITSTTLELPTGFDRKVTREWTIEETGTVGNVQITVDVAGMGLGTIASITLVIDEDGNADFTDGTIRQVAQTSNSGTVVTFDNVNFADGEKFTLAGNACVPAGISNNLHLWLKADAGTNTTTEDDDITTWNGQGLKGYVADDQGGDGPDYRSNGINFNPALDFASEDLSIPTGLTEGQTKNSFFFYIVSQRETNGNMEIMRENLASSRFLLFRHLGTGAQAADYYYGNGTSGQGRFFSTWDNSETLPHLWTIGSDATSSATPNGTRRYISQDNNVLVSNNASANNTGTGTNDMYIGSNNGTNNFYDGLISEIIVLDGTPTLSEENKIQSYLAIKYGITMDSTSGNAKYINSSGTVIYDNTTTYDHDITAIGRDDFGCINQKQSRSVNSDAAVSMGLGTIAADNPSNVNTFSSDGDFMFWGNDDASVVAGTGELPGGFTRKVTREWTIQETGTVGNVQLIVDVTGMGLGEISNITLVIDEDGNGDFTDGTIRQVTQTSNSGTNVTFDNVNFANGEKFTFATNSPCSPGGISNNLHLWLRADAGINQTTDNDDVTSWNDQGPNGFIPEDGLVAPTFLNNGVNFNPTLEFGGANHQLIVDDGIFEGGVKSDMFTYVISNVNGTNQVLVNQNVVNVVSASTYQLQINNGSNAFYDFGRQTTGTGRTTGAWGASTGQTYLWSAGAASTTATPLGFNKYITRDNNTVSTHNGTSTANGGTNDFYIGTFNNNGNDVNGSISEIVILDGIPTDGEEDRIQSYLAIKYGITLDSTTGNMKYRASTGSVVYDNTSTYNNDIAGIGRDDNGCLNQKQSMSVNTDAAITIGLGTIAADNSSNANTFTSDGDFMVWGNDDATIVAAAAELPGGFDLRVPREWAVEETGTVGNVQLILDVSGMGLGNVSNITLVVDEDGNSDFTDGTIRQVSQASSTGTTVTFDNVNFADGEKFTFATTTPCSPGGVSNNLHFWMKADAGTNTTTDANNITTWLDQGPNGFVAEDGLVAPTFLNNGTNFNPTLEFGGANHQLIVDDGIFEGGVKSDMFTYVISNVNGTNQVLVNQNVVNVVSASTYQLQINNGSNAFYDFGRQTTATGRTNGAWGASTGQTYLWSAGAASTTVTPLGFNKYITRDNNTVSTHNGTSTANGGTNDFYIGTFNNNGNDVNGSISEIVILDGIPTDGEEDRIQSYLAIKYGITLDSTTGNMKYRASTGSVVYDNTTTYNNDIAGIGRDDNGCLNQKQSMSVNTDAAITIGLGTIAADNSSNANTFTSDGDFMIWGNDDVTLQSTTSELPTGFERKVTREWAIEETGTVGNVQLTVDITGLGLGEIALVTLVIDEDGNGDFTDGTIRQVAQASNLGTTVTFNNVNFADGEIFTFAASICAPAAMSNNLHAWFKADEGTNTTTEEADVTSWFGQGLGGFIANSGITAPTYLNSAINFNPTLYFGGGDHQLIVDEGIFEGGIKADMFTYAVALINGTNQVVVNQNIVNVGGASTYQLQLNNSSNAYYDFGRQTTGTGRTNGTWGASTGIPYLWSAGAASTTVTPLGFNKYITRDNNTVSTHNGTSTADGSTNDFYIGTFNDNGNDFNGYLSELIILDGIPTALEEDRIQSYLAIKYGITLNGMDYVNSSGATIWTNAGGYDSDIAGIGREDAGCLHQKQSKSINLQTIVTMSTEALAADNESNSTSITDGAYLLWGNNDGADDTTTSEMPAGYHQRLEKEWLVEMTGTVSNVHVKFDLVNVNFPQFSEGVIYLLVDTDGDGDFTTGSPTAIVASSIDASAAWFDDVNFSDGDYFTIAQIPVDTDGDGYNDLVDLDDDNDGILDDDEGCGGNGNGSGPSSYADNVFWFEFSDASLANGVHEGDSITFTLPSGENVKGTFTNVSAGASKLLPQPLNTFAGAQLKEGYDSLGNLITHALYNTSNGLNATFTITLDTALNLVVGDAERLNVNGGPTTEKYWLTTHDGGNWELLERYGTGPSHPISGTGTTIVSATGVAGNSTAAVFRSLGATSITIRIESLGAPNGAQGVAIGAYLVCSGVDFDGDGTPDHLDLDSDNDGCPDAIEGDDSFIASDLSGDRLTGGQDATGTPVVANGGQGRGSSVNATIWGCNIPLPVDLINFTAHQDDCHGVLQWTTSWERNNDFFEVQYSYDGKTWKTIGEVQGAGDSDGLNSYEFYDTHCEHYTTVYYRLLQNDFDGNVTESPIITLGIAGDVWTEAFPNPTSDELTVFMGSTRLEITGHIVLTNIEGKELIRVPAELGHTKLDMSDLPNGIYVLKTIVPGEPASHTRVLKLN